MSVIITDARAALRDSVGDISSEVMEVLYADDTLIVDEHGELAQIYMDIIATQGNHYGLVFNWSKLEYMCIGCSLSLVQLDGSLIKYVTSMTYLRRLLLKDANITSELGLKIGYALHSYSNLQRIWSHANFLIRRKLTLFKSLILSKLQYGFESLWLNWCERKQLDAFHCKCLRRIMKI